MSQLVTVMLARIPTLSDYKIVGLSGGSDDMQMLFGNSLINELMPQFNGNLLLIQRTIQRPTGPFSNPIDVVSFECNSEGFEGNWILPANMFTVRSKLNLKD